MLTLIERGATKDLSEVNIVLVRGGPGVSLRKAGSPRLCKRARLEDILFVSIFLDQRTTHDQLSRPGLFLTICISIH